MEQNKVNIYQGQIQGPFKANEDLMNKVVEQCKTAPKYIKHLGIQTETDNILINPNALVTLIICGKEQTIEIGKTNCYEIGNTKVTSIKFLEDKDNNTIIDYTAILNEKDPDSESTM